jgi:hypothetical protein
MQASQRNYLLSMSLNSTKLEFKRFSCLKCKRVAKFISLEFNQSIPKFITIVVDIIFMNTIRESYPQLFTVKWLSDNSRQIMTSILKTVASELNDIEQQNLIINIIHYRMLVKEALEYLVNSYIEQLIVFIKLIYKAHANM